MKNKIVLVLSLISGLSVAQELHDPTISRELKVMPPSSEPRGLPGDFNAPVFIMPEQNVFILNGVIVDIKNSKNSKAIIAGEIFSVGEEVKDGLILTTVRNNEVVLIHKKTKKETIMKVKGK